MDEDKIEELKDQLIAEGWQRRVVVMEELKDQLIAEGWQTPEEARSDFEYLLREQRNLSIRTTQFQIVAGILFVVVLFQILPILATAWGW
jgi:hypothetical protein